MKKALIVGYDNERTHELTQKLEHAGYEVEVQDKDLPIQGMSFDFVIVDELSEDKHGK